VVLPAGHYVGPWRFEHRVHLKAFPGATLSPGEARDEGRATLTLQAGGQVEGLTIESAVKGYALRVDRGSTTLSGLHLVGGGEAGLYLVASEVSVSGCDFEGNDYGVLTEGPSTLEVSGSHFRRNYRAGVAVVYTAATVKDSEFTGPFYEAAVTVIHSESVTLSGNRVAAAGAIGIKLLLSKAVLVGGRIKGARSDGQGLEGNGLYAFQSTVDADGLHIEDTRGTAVSVIGGRVALNHCEIRQSSEAAAYVSGGGTLVLQKCLLADTPIGVFVDPDGTARIETTRFERVEQARVKGQ
jgi:hypothetical protein